MELNTLVSIITPCYNAEAFIAITIQSVVEQTYKNWEMLICDDCSTDCSAGIIKEYCRKDCRIKYLKTEKPSGSPALPRNIAIDKAQGRYLAFLDSDDIWLPDKLEEQLKLIEEKRCPIVYSNYEKMDENGKRSNRIIYAPQEVTMRHFEMGNPLPCLTVLVDTHVTGKFHFPNMHHEDCIAWIGLVQKFGKAYNTNTVAACYRVQKNSVSGNKLKILSWQWNVFRNVLHFSILKSIWCYVRYAYLGFIKSRK